MDKLVPKAGEGILGAIKAATHRLQDSPSKQEDDNLPAYSKVRRPEFKPGSRVSIAPGFQLDSAPESSESSEKNQNTNAELSSKDTNEADNPAANNPRTESNRKDVAELDASPGDLQRDLSESNSEQDRERRKVREAESNLQLLNAERREEATTQLDGSQTDPAISTQFSHIENDPRVDIEPILPETRPAVINRDVDSALESLDLQIKEHQYLVEKIRTSISNRLTDSGITHICKPDLSISGPILETLKYVAHQPEIFNLYANLMSTAMDEATAKYAHPGFIDLIKNLCPDEVKVLQYLLRVRVIPLIDIKKINLTRKSEKRVNTLVSTVAGDANCQHEDMAESYLSNLERIGLIEIPKELFLTDEKVYERILNAPPVMDKLRTLNSAKDGSSGSIVKYYAKLSIYGLQFSKACLFPKSV